MRPSVVRYSIVGNVDVRVLDDIMFNFPISIAEMKEVGVYAIKILQRFLSS